MKRRFSFNRYFLYLIPILLGFVHPVKAQTLFSDDFNGSQTGSLAPLTYNFVNNATVSGGNLVLTNTSTAPGGAELQYDFSTVNAPLTINLHAIPSNDSDSGSWMAITFSTDTNAGSFITSQPLGILFRENGEDELWNSGFLADDTWGGPTDGNTYYDFSMVLSDGAGTGSAFNDTSSQIQLFANNSLVGTYTLNTPLSSGQGYITLTSYNPHGGQSKIDTFTVTAAPEPSTWALLALGACLIFAFRFNTRSRCPLVV